MPSHQGNIVLTGYLAKQLSIIFIESYNTIGWFFLATSELLLLVIWGGENISQPLPSLK